MEARSARTLIEMLQNQGIKGTEFTMYMGRTLMLIADEPGLSQKEIVKKLDMPQGNVNRIMAALCDGSPKKRGLKLVKSTPNIYDWRSSEYYLSAKGVALIEQIKSI